MPFAKDDTICQDKIPGAISITQSRYAEALEAKLNGRETIVLDGVLVIRDQSPGDDFAWQGGAWVQIPDEQTPAAAP